MTIRADVPQPQEAREGLAALNGLLGTIGSTLDIAQVLERVLEACHRLLGTERNLILLLENGDSLVHRASSGFDRQALEDVRASVGGSVFGRALAMRRPVRLGAGTVRTPESLASELAQLRWGLVVPLMSGERPLGVLLIGTVATRPFSNADETLLRALTDQAATAIDHAQRYQEAVTRGERLAMLLQFSQQAAAHRPYEDLLPLIAEEARRLLGATAAAVRLVDGEELTIAVWAGAEAALTGPTRLRMGEGLCGRVAASGRALGIPDTRDAGEPHRAEATALAARGIRAYLGVPLRVREGVTGVLAVYGAEPDGFREDDMALLAGFAGQAAVAVENARLVQQLLHAERLSAVGRIVVGVAHELNNPLAVVVGTADLLRREGVEGRVAERLQRISGQAQRAVKIVRSLLTLARRTPTPRSAIDVHQLLGETLELEAYALRSAHVTVVSRLSPGLPPVLGDADQLQQVFTNLVLNAVEAMGQAHGGGTLTVATRYEARTERVAVAVTDDGPGIAPCDAGRVFEPFFTTKREGKGTGLGLAICRQIVESHRGRITVESPPGAGATFTVEVPVARGGGPQPVDAPRRPEGPAAGGTTVLLVEDERVVGDLLAEFLQRDGHSVDRAADGREALALVRQRAYALIVSDVRMPDVDGPALYHELRTVNPDLTRRMVFVTGDVMRPETRRFLEETGLAYLEKPFGITEFQAVIRGVLSQSAGENVE